jgi:hypothetical protein
MGKKKNKKRKSRYDRMMEAHGKIVAHLETGGRLTEEDAAKFSQLQKRLKHIEKSRFGDQSPSDAQEKLVKQAVGWHRSAVALTDTLTLIGEVLDEAWNEKRRSYRSGPLRPIHKALQEGGAAELVKWAAGEVERRAREEIEDDHSGDSGDDAVDGDGGVAVPSEKDEAARAAVQ